MFFFANTYLNNNPSMKKDVYHCALYYASPIFFLFFVFVILTSFSYYHVRKYAAKKAAITRVEVLVSTISRPFLFSTSPPNENELRYRYDIQYDHEGKIYTKVIEHTRAMKVGDTMDIFIYKKTPDQLRPSSTGMDDFFIIFMIIVVYLFFRSLFLGLILLTNMGRVSICADGIMGSFFGRRNSSSSSKNTTISADNMSFDF